MKNTTQDSEMMDIRHDMKEQSLPGPWPWYALIILGIGLSGFFVWFMVCWALWARGRKKLCFLGLSANLAVMAIISFAGGHATWEWWKVTLAFQSLDLLWTLGGVAFHVKHLGLGSGRYKGIGPEQWAPPLVVGGLLGFCLAAIVGIPDAISNRIEMLSLWDSLNREIVLWDFFKGTFSGVIAGMLVGAWWAGNPGGFRTRDLVVYLVAAIPCQGLIALLFVLQFYLLSGGDAALDMDSIYYSLVPPWASKDTQWANTLNLYAGYLAFLVLPLLFGSPRRFRDFAKRTLIIPLAFICGLPFIQTHSEWWESTQGRTAYNMSSAEKEEMAKAQDRIEILLSRYPDHARWPAFAENHASYLYHEGRSDEAMEYYRRIYEKSKDSNQWYWYARHTKAILDLGEPAKRNPLEWLDIPVVDHESYLTSNWMGLLSVIRYWEGESVPESQIKSRLRAMSEQQDRISLRPLLSLAHLSDAAENLGYKAIILPAERDLALNLLEKGIPVLCESYQRIYLMYGYDKGRSLSLAYNFSRISNRRLKDTREETEEVLGLEDEGQGNSRLRRERIRNEAYWELADFIWDNPERRTFSPYMAVVVPESYGEIVAQVAGLTEVEVEKSSKAMLAGLIGLLHMRAGDPARAIEWAQVSYNSVEAPFPLYVAHLANTLWKDRSRKIKSQIQLENRFTELQEVFDFFGRSETRDFLKLAEERFLEDFETSSLPWLIGKNYLSLLHKKDPEDRKILAKAYKDFLEVDPIWSWAWKNLAEVYELDQDIPNMVWALDEYISARPFDTSARLNAAYGYVLIGEPEKAKETLEASETKSLRHEANYQFVLGAIAEWEDKTEKALAHYGAAVDMRRHTPVYHLHYGRLLLAQGETEKAEKALKWASRIDAMGDVKEQALAILHTMENNT